LKGWLNIKESRPGEAQNLAQDPLFVFLSVQEFHVQTEAPDFFDQNVE
jgi:hypothetical protein